MSTVVQTEEAPGEASSARSSSGRVLHRIMDLTSHKRTDKKRVRRKVFDFSDLAAAGDRTEMEYSEA
jgi:hypothetical protein